MKAAETSTAKRHGFTLVELSVVLVIIGLIVGAVLMGRDLIKAAEIRGAISELSTIQTSIIMFQDKYKALPGDMNNATTYWPGVTSNGNGDGYFGISDTAQDQEGGYLWHHLGLSGLYKSFKRPNAANFSHNYGVNTPQILPNTAAVGQRRTPDTSSYVRYGTTSNYIQLGKYNGSTGGSVLCPTVDANTAYLIDTKIDNGNPSSGEVLAYVASSVCAAPPPTCTDYTGAGDDYLQPSGSLNYDFTKPAGRCRMAFLIFS